MLPDRVSNPGPLTYESGALPIALRGPAIWRCAQMHYHLHLTLKVPFTAAADGNVKYFSLFFREDQT